MKPLLKWIQSDPDALLLGLGDRSAHLYVVNQQTVRRIDSILYPSSIGSLEGSGDYESLKREKANSRKLIDTTSWISEWLGQMIGNERPRLYLAGGSEPIEALAKNLHYPNTVWPALRSRFDVGDVNELSSLVRRNMQKEINQTLERKIEEFSVAEQMNLTLKNIFRISRAAAQGRIRKLIVAEEIKIFGKLDFESGALSLHPCDLDHEDDDVLDDLAQAVLARGGEVIVANRDQIPRGGPISAIVDGEIMNLDMVHYTDLSESNVRTAL